MQTARKEGQGSETRKRSTLHAIRLSPDERAELMQRAQDAGLSVAAFVRHQALGQPGPRSVRRISVNGVLVRQLMGELNRVGNNLNQIARAVNIEGDTFGLEPVIDRLDEVFASCLNALGKSPP